MNKDDVHSISYALGGRDAPCGDIYIKVRDISWIDGKFVSVSNTTLSCGLDVKGNCYVNLIADDLESAIKIGAEKRAMFLAEKEGIN